MPDYVDSSKWIGRELLCFPPARFPETSQNPVKDFKTDSEHYDVKTH
jgi:hypothetical protein